MRIADLAFCSQSQNQNAVALLSDAANCIFHYILATFTD